MTMSNNDITRSGIGTTTSSVKSFIFNRPKIRILSITLTICALTVFQFVDFNPFPENRRLMAIADTMEIPTHIYLCNEFLERNSRMNSDEIESPLKEAGLLPNDDMTKLGQDDAYLVVEERKETCLSETDSAIFPIFASALMEQLGSLFLGDQWSIEYRHGCGKHRVVREHSTIQEHLSVQLFLHHHLLETRMTQDQLQQTCQRCVMDYISLGSSDGSCLLFSPLKVEGTDETVLPIQEILPALQSNLEKATSAGKDIETRKLSFHIASHVEEEIKAVIYLACPSDSGTCEVIVPRRGDNLDQANTLPPFSFATQISPYIKVIDIVLLAPEEDMDRPPQALNQLRAFRRGLRPILTQMYPTARILITEESSSKSLYKNLLTAQQVICPINSAACSIPALARKNTGRVLDRISLMESPSEYNWMRHMKHDSRVNIELQSVKSFFEKPFPCSQIRSQAGHWEQDLDMAPKMQYAMGQEPFAAGRANHFYVPTEEEPYRKPTTYKWVQNLYPQCEVPLLTREKFCSTVTKLGLSRVMFLGDSLQGYQAESFWFLLESKRIPKKDAPAEHKGKYEYNYGYTDKIDCGTESSPNMIDISFVRNDRLLETNNRDFDCKKEFCYPFTNRYMSYPGKTLLIFNTGSHCTSRRTGPPYQDVILNFIHQVQNIFHKPDDILFFRTTAPGHGLCESATEPYGDFDAYLNQGDGDPGYWGRVIGKGYEWEKFGDMNTFAMEAIEQHNQYISQTEQVEAAPIHILDPYYMTLLRPDGHFGSSDNMDQDKRKKGDCLHYSLPGPPDWWNHLLWSEVMDLASQQDEETTLSTS